jgi:hypothetical protein
MGCRNESGNDNLEKSYPNRKLMIHIFSLMRPSTFGETVFFDVM